MEMVNKKLATNKVFPCIHLNYHLFYSIMKRIYSIQCTLNASDPVYFKWQNKKSKYLAAAVDNTVNFYNRHGDHIDQINLFGYELAFFAIVLD